MSSDFVCQLTFSSLCYLSSLPVFPLLLIAFLTFIMHTCTELLSHYHIFISKSFVFCFVHVKFCSCFMDIVFSPHSLRMWIDLFCFLRPSSCLFCLFCLSALSLRSLLALDYLFTFRREAQRSLLLRPFLPKVWSVCWQH